MPEAFYKENYPIVYGYLLSLCGEPALAEDLTAEAFLKAIEKIHTYDPRYKPATWLCTIGRNLFLNHQKKASRHVPLDENMVSPAPTPEEQVFRSELLKALMKSAEELPPTTRQVLFMRLENLSFRQIGLALGKTENWARVTFFRAKSKLLKEMEEWT